LRGGELIVAVGLICQTDTGVIVEELSSRGKVLDAPTIDFAKREILNTYIALERVQKLMVKFEKVTEGYKYIIYNIKNSGSEAGKNAAQPKKQKRGKGVWKKQNLYVGRNINL
jgi:hypothetical protein